MGLIINADGTVEVWDNVINRYGKSNIEKDDISYGIGFSTGQAMPSWPKGSKNKRTKKKTVTAAPTTEQKEKSPILPSRPILSIGQRFRNFLDNKISTNTFITREEIAYWVSFARSGRAYRVRSMIYEANDEIGERRRYQKKTETKKERRAKEKEVKSNNQKDVVPTKKIKEDEPLLKFVEADIKVVKVTKADKILSILQNHPRSKVEDIAQRLLMSTSDVSHILNVEIRNKVSQDSKGRWSRKYGM